MRTGRVPLGKFLAKRSAGAGDGDLVHEYSSWCVDREPVCEKAHCLCWVSSPRFPTVGDPIANHDLGVRLPGSGQCAVLPDVTMDQGDLLVTGSRSKPRRLAESSGSIVRTGAGERSRFLYVNIELLSSICGQITISLESAPEFSVTAPLVTRPPCDHNGYHMAMTLEARSLLIRYLLRELSLRAFVKRFMPILVEDAFCSDATPRLFAEIQHALVEHSAGAIDEDRLRARLSALASEVVELVPQNPVTRTASTTMVVAVQMRR